jgi:uncharacterized protein YcbX
MTRVGHVESLWRYPVKSMRGEELRAAWLGAGGMAGDRRYAVVSSAAPESFPYLTGRTQERMLLYRPMLTDAGVEVETAEGERLAIDSPRLLALLGEGLRQEAVLSLRRSDAALSDAQPISLFSIQTAAQLARETGSAVDKRRFRANIYADLCGSSGFLEDTFVGRTLKIGETAVLSVVERDPRCKMITLDPDTAEAAPALIKHVAGAHERCAGVYATVLTEGEVRVGDEISLVD